MDTIKFSVDFFVEKSLVDTKIEYQVYSVQKDGWFNIDEKYIKEKAIANNGWPRSSLSVVEQELKDFLSIQGREGIIIKRVITTIIDPDGPLVRNIQMTETIIKRDNS